MSVGLESVGLQSVGLPPDVAASGTITLAGNAATSAAGTLSPTISLALTGNAATASQGTVTPALSLALTGNAATASAGTVTPALSLALTGNTATSSAGTPVAGLSLPLTGNSATASSGTVSVSGVLVPAGQSVTASVGTVAPGITLAITGNGAVASAGTVSVPGDLVAAGKRKRHPVLVEIHGRIQEFETIAAAEAYIISLEPAEEKQIQAKAKRIAKAVVRTGNAFVPPVFEPVRVLEAAPEFKAAVNMRAALTQARLNEAVNQQIAKELQNRDDEENAVAVMLLM